MSSKQIEVNIAGQPYKFAVSVDNEAALREAAAMVDNQMTRIKNGSNTKGIERARDAQDAQDIKNTKNTKLAKDTEDRTVDVSR